MNDAYIDCSIDMNELNSIHQILEIFNKYNPKLDPHILTKMDLYKDNLIIVEENVFKESNILKKLNRIAESFSDHMLLSIDFVHFEA